MKFIQKARIKTCIIVSSCVLITGILIVISTMFYRYARDDIEKEYYQHSITITNQETVFLNQSVKELISCIFDIKYNTQIDEEISCFFMDEVNYWTATSNIVRELSEVERTNDLVSSVYIYTPNGDFYNYSKFKVQGFVFGETSIYGMLRKLEDSTIYWGIAQENEIFQGKSEIIPMAMRYKKSGYQYWVYTVINLNVTKLESYLRSIDTTNGNEIIVVNESGEVIAGSDTEHARKVMSDATMFHEITSRDNNNEEKYFNIGDSLITYQRLNVVSWYIINIHSQEALLRNILSLKHFMIILSIIGIVVSMIVSVLISNAIIYPLKNFEHTIKKVTEGNLDVTCSYTGDNEVGTLAKSFNYMLRKIKELIGKLNTTIEELEIEKKRVYKEQELKRTAELRALQAQINPHFLYNTLSTITWMAYEKEDTEVYRIASSMGDFYRIALSRGQEVIPVRTELEHVKKYLEIQKFRYGDKLHYTFDIDDEANEYLTVKLILQPLVENAIYHGIKVKGGEGEIKISVTYNGASSELEFVVYDNGVGMDSETLEKINLKLHNGEKVLTEGYGIFNVNERIKLFYGDTYGLSLASTEGKETYATILLPAAHMEDKED